MTEFGKLSARDRLLLVRGRRATRRCGICDEQIERGEPRRYVDDEPCHVACAAAGEKPEEEVTA